VGVRCPCGMFCVVFLWVAGCGERLWWLCGVFVACVGVVLVGQLK